MADKQTILTHLDRARVWLYFATGELLYLDLPTTIMKDMEILNHELFLKQFESFLNVHGVRSSHAYITVSESLTFIKDFSGMEPGKQEEAIKLFVDNVPFENVAKSILHLDKVTRVITVNKDAVLLMKSALVKQNCEVELAVPIGAFNSVSTQGGVTPQLCSQILGSIENLKDHNLFDPSPILNPLQSITENAADKKHPKRLPILLGAFGGLIAILVSVVVVTNSQPTIPPSQAETLAPLPTKKVALSPTATASATLHTLKIDLLSTANTASISAIILMTMKDSGVSDIRQVVDISSSNGASESQLTFDQRIPVSIQEQIIAIVRPVLPQLTTRVVGGLQRDVEIRLR